MYDSAHGVDRQHAIFQGPLSVQLEFVQQEKPDDYFLYPGTATMVEKIEVWTVQTKTFPEIDPGLVSSRNRFTKTPGAEVISGGINGKGPDSVAIGRHGNYFLWGFSARPEYMTESARRVFVNSITYIQQFDGKAASSVVQAADPREAARSGVYRLRRISDDYLDSVVRKFQETIKVFSPPEDMLKEIGDDPKSYFRKRSAKYALEELERIPDAVRKLCDDDTEKLIEYYDDNFEYLKRGNAGQYVVDEDVKELGISNRKIELLEKCIAMLESKDQAKRAIRILERYAKPSITNGEQWITWWKDNQAKIRYDANEEKFFVPSASEQ